MQRTRLKSEITTSVPVFWSIVKVQPTPEKSPWKYHRAFHPPPQVTAPCKLQYLAVGKHQKLLQRQKIAETKLFCVWVARRRHHEGFVSGYCQIPHHQHGTGGNGRMGSTGGNGRMGSTNSRGTCPIQGEYLLF